MNNVKSWFAVLPCVLWQARLLAVGAAVLLASVPMFAAAADEVVTLRIRSDGWTVQQLDSERDAWHKATIRLVKDGLTYMTEQGAVRLRGSSTVKHHGYVKKNYSLEFHDANGNDKKVSIPFLGLNAESDFVLFSSFWDPSYLRNVISYKLYRQMGRWAPRTRYIHLVINGESRGLYILTEKIKRGPTRVNLPKLVDRTDGVCSLRGGYIFKRDGDDSGWTWQSSYFPQMKWTLHYPDPDEASPAQKQSITGHMSAIDAFFATSSWQWAYPTLIDVGSWVDYTLLTELSMNGDGYYKSFYFHTQVTDKCSFTPLIMGPPWDFDLAYGNAGGEDYNGGTNSVGCRIEGNMVHSNSDIRLPHIAKLWGDSKFKKALKDRWLALRQNVLSESNIMTLIDDYSRSIANTRDADWKLWSSKLLPSRGPGWPSPCHRNLSLAGETQALKNFIRQRIEFMDRHIGSF